MLTKISDHILYKDKKFYASFPAVIGMNDGKILLLFRRARDARWLLEDEEKGLDSVDHLDSRSQLVVLHLNGAMETLNAPQPLPIDPEAADQDANLFLLPSGRIVASGFTWYPVTPAVGKRIRSAGGACVGAPEETGCLYVFWGGYVRISDDGGQSWSSHVYLPPLPERSDAVPGRRLFHGGAIRGRMTFTLDGRLLLASYAPDPKHHKQVSHLFVSTNQGETWSYQGIIARDPEGKRGYVEPTLLSLESGQLLAFHRTFETGDRLAISWSDDGGQSWQPPVFHDILGHPYDALSLGRISRENIEVEYVLLVYGYRHIPYGVRARLWRPALEKLEEAEEIIIRSDSPSADVGYPSVARLSDGTILVVYYFCDPDGVRHIAASRLCLGV